MDLDTGSAVSVIPEKIFKEKFQNIKLEPSDLVLRTFSGEKLGVVGKTMVTVKYQLLLIITIHV